MQKDNVYYLDNKKHKGFSRTMNYRKNEKRKKKILLIVILLIIILIFVAFYYLFHNKPVLTLAVYDELVDGFETKALVVRDEIVQYSPVSGFAKLLKKEGERVYYGQEIINIDNNTVYNYRPGLISYAVDYLEDKLQPDSLRDITANDFNDYQRKFQQLVNSRYVSEGDPVFRVINNDCLYLVIKAKTSELKRYRPNEKVFVQSTNLKYGMIDAYIIDIIEGEEEGLLIISLNLFIPEWLNVRFVEIKFIKNIYRGIVIPQSAIFTQPEGEGILVYNSNGTHAFKKTSILEKAGSHVVVDGVEVGDNVITNPWTVEYGRDGGNL